MLVSNPEHSVTVQPYVEHGGSATILSANPLDGKGSVVHGIGMTTKRNAAAQPDRDEEVPGAVLQRTFGENFRVARLAAGLNQREVAAQSGVNQVEISKIERGMVNLTLRTMDRLAKAIDHGADRLLQAQPSTLSKPTRRP